MKTRKILALVLSLVMVFSLCSTAFAAHLTNEVTELEAQNSDLSMELATNSYVLFENNGVLPLVNIEKNVAVFGSGSEYTIKGGTGSGDVNQRARDHVDEAFEAAGWEIANPTWIAKMAATNPQSGCMGTGPKKDIAITDADMAEATANTDLAVYVIARNAGEFQDRTATKGDYYLSDVERANLEAIAANFENVVVVLNTCVVDTAFVREIANIDAVVYMGNGGQRGSEALVKVLTGEVTPSGKITDTWPLSIEDYPSYEGFGSNDGNQNTEWYFEGIYNGYRYFDTWGMDVAYEFGFGGSYTEFDIDVVDVAIDGTAVEVVVDVTNVGAEYSGKEVVQVYFSAPDGRLEKPYQELAAYGKTDELEPGEKQTLTLTYATTDMSSYDEELAAYIMDAGKYIIRVGNSSRNTEVAAVATLGEMTITEQLSNQIVPEVGIEEWSKAGQTPISYAEEAAEIAAAPVFAIENLPFANNASEYDDETTTTYIFAEEAEDYVARKDIVLRTKTIAGNLENVGNRGGYAETIYDEVVEIVPALPEGITKETAKLTDVYTGKITMEQFVACLSNYELSRLCVGNAGTPAGEPIIGSQADSVPGGAGQTTMEMLYTRHIPSMPNADGPAGIRISQSFQKDTDGDGRNDTTYYQFCTAFPAGTCMAMAWDTDLNYLMGEAVGLEMLDYGVTTWLAPALNIHRNALCGRNFEYFSEDPLVSGIVAAHLTAGVQATAGIGVTLKHFWGNSQETNRNAENNVISERAAREIYLKGFEICVKLAQPTCVMNCYNGNNGWPGSDDFDTNWDILRGEWGFKGYVMTDWGGGQSSAQVAKHGGCDMVMPGGSTPSVVLDYIGTAEPTFNADGSINRAGSFEATAGGTTEYKVVVAGGYDAVAQSVRTAVAEGKAAVTVTAEGAVVTWYGYHVGRIVRGDVQKSAINVLNVAIQSKDMVNLCKGLDIDVEITPWTELQNAPLANGWAQVTKGEVVNTSLVAGTVVADSANGEALVDITYAGDVAISSVRFTVDSELEIADIVVPEGSEYQIENNNGYVIIYKLDGSEIDGVLCTLVYDLNNWPANGEYAIDLEIVDATDMDEADIALTAVDGAVIIDNTYVAGDVNMDGDVTNSDVIAIARYLVDLVEFNADQLEVADVDADGEVDNADLIKVARAIVAA